MTDGEKPLLAKSMTGTSKLVEEDSMAPRTPTSTLPQPAAKRSVWVWVGAIIGLVLLVGLIAGLVVGLQGRAATSSVSSSSASSPVSPTTTSADSMTLYISAERKDCTGMMPMKWWATTGTPLRWP
jgi:hypothetical protein